MRILTIVWAILVVGAIAGQADAARQISPKRVESPMRPHNAVFVRRSSFTAAICSRATDAARTALSSSPDPNE